MALKVKTPEQAQAQNEFINSVNRNQLAIQESIWSLDDLNKLEPDELVARLDAVETQSVLIKWRILWALRQKFASDKLFGQYLISISESSRPEWLSSPRDVGRSIAAGRFCAENNITDLRETAVLKGAIYALSVMKDEKEAKNILNKIKKKNVAIPDVLRMIEQTKAVSTIEKVDVINYEQEPTPLKVVLVENNAVVETKPEQAIEAPVEAEIVAQTAFSYPVLSVKEVDETESPVTDERVQEVMAFVGKYQLSLLDLILLFKRCIEVVNRLRYPKG